MGIVEGVLAGAAFTVVKAMTNMLTLYRKLEDVTVQFAGSLGYLTRAGFLAVIALQVLFYGLWSGLVQRGKNERARLAGVEKVARKLKNSFPLDTNRHGLDTRHEYEGAIVMQNSYFIRRAPRKCFFQ